MPTQTAKPTVRPTATIAPTSSVAPIATETPFFLKKRVKVSAKLNGSNKVILKWKKIEGTSGYVVYRSTKKSKGYERIADVASAKYRDKKVKRGKVYYYKVTAYVREGNRIINGGAGKVCKIEIPYLVRPVFFVSKGRSDGIRYLQINLKKYNGKYIEIYIRRKNSSYKKVALKSNKISYHKGKLRLGYSVQGVRVFCKIRTYTIKGKKKQYSDFSKEQKVKS